MKKIILSVICLCMALSFCGCGEKKDEEVSSAPTFYDGESTITLNANDIIDEVKSGEVNVEYEDVNDDILTQKISLRMSSVDFRASFNEKVYYREEGTRFIRYTIGGYFIYFTNDDTNSGIAAIVNPDTVYGFEPTITTENDVVAVLGNGIKNGAVPEDVADMLLYGESGSTYQVYKYDDNVVAFFFGDDGKLKLTVLSQDGLWLY
ncbi:MAG: hypothetical protein IJ944_04715 [Clostridia bacterium]|nr:hypothetical protein [Clostridia bacterium]